jgi:DNA invertase Pin-like site-specific DNA recombinase
VVADCTDAAVSGSVAPDARPALSQALTMLARGQADVLVAAKVDRLSRSVLDFATLVARAQRQGWALVVLDLDVDMTSPAGELLAHIVASTAQYERRLISVRTRDALAVARARGITLGRPPVLEESVVERIVRDRAAGLTSTAIAAALTDAGIRTARGARTWQPSSVLQVTRSRAGRAAAVRLGLALPTPTPRTRRRAA